MEAVIEKLDQEIDQAVPAEVKAKLTKTPLAREEEFGKEYKILKPRKLPNGFVSVKLHYSVHPERGGDGWLESVTQGMSKEDIQREYDCAFIGGERRVFPHEALFDEDDFPIITAEYKTPEAGHRYVIGGDAASGRSSGNFACGVVLDVNTWCEVAHIHLRIDPKNFGIILNYLGRRYNNAEIAVEHEKWGAFALAKLQELRYPRLYYRKRRKSLKRRAGTNRAEKYERILGWETNVKTKLLMIEDLAEAIVARTLGIATEGTLSEMDSFIETDSGIMKAAKGAFDDRVIATAIALQLLLKSSQTMYTDDTYNDILLGDELSTVENPASLVVMDTRMERSDELISHKADW